MSLHAGPASPNRRKAVQLLGTSLLAGCSSTPTLDMARQALGASFSSSKSYPRSRAEVDALPYAQLGVRQGKAAPGILVLTEKSQQELRWISADRILIATRGQRVVRTVGLQEEIRSTRLLGPDLLDVYDPANPNLQGLALRYLVDLMPGDRFEVPVDSKFFVEGPETIDILGQPTETLRVREEVHCESWDWKTRNYHWLSLRSRLAWRSSQSLSPDQPPLLLEVLKRAA